AIAQHEQNDKVRFIDLRDVRELWKEGTIPGSTHIPRGMLEFWIDPLGPYSKKIFVPEHKFIFFCASGIRSALAAKTAQDMGLEMVAHIEGGFTAWKKHEGPFEKVKQPRPRNW
ncbi:MAG: rhodanese-like domain-containing protein, partial [Pseudomonadota bacterium]